ncbi:outer membrane protein assembly factor BamD [Ferrimonas marina]|uniref:Outer membrane protein assembly factor BamD n=1 Tax=Ferrimonas marina TaxID=299255 RepID=A0A1M5X0C9_9GAMM|nr:outer membrane protein assembly factor BamD [Ferrimonas marina]SHH92894.1 Beta-barrel assembly machine subunit BamD [Ferrimonas marina]
MRKITGPLLLAVSSLLVVTGCSSSGDDNQFQLDNRSPETLYNDARQAMELGNFTRASEMLEALDSRYPFGAHKTQVQLDLIYAYYKLDDSASALANVDRFIRLNPTHPDIDYVYYMRGLVNMQTDSYLFHEMVGMDRSDRDPSNAISAFRDFETLIKTYPDSRYAPDALKRMQMLKNRLAEYSLRVAEYYVTMEAWVAAANRAQLVLETYPDTPATEKALEIMVRSYGELEMSAMEDHSRQVLKATYPDNRLVR